MLRFRIRLVLLLLGLPALFVSACTTIATPAYRGLYSTSSCPAGTVRICDRDSVGGCGCGEFVSF